jgi:hypothetical protein
MRIWPSEDGTFDHYLSKKNRPDLTYEWSNYRYCTKHVNTLKGNYDDRILDPFEVQDDWFEIQIPSLQIVLTNQVPIELREKAEFTLQQLQLNRSTRTMELRASYYDDYQEGVVTLEFVERNAPLLGRAIRAEIARNASNL